MKIAIVGDNPTAIEISYFFHKLGAATTTFYNQSRDPYFQHLSWLGQRPEIFHALVPKFTSTEYGQNSNIADYFENLISKKFEELKNQQSVKSSKVIRIQKQFLFPNEIIKNKSRLVDLFRIVYQENPDQVIEEQKKNNPDVFESLSSDFLNSLKLQMEGYEDFDIVIDVSSINTFKKYMGNGDVVIGEKALRKNKQIDYGIDALKVIETEILFSEGNYNEYAIIGSQEIASLALIQLSPLLASKKIRLFIISEEEMPFLKIIEKKDWLGQKIESILKDQEQQLKAEQEIFQRKWHEWQDLEDYMRAKVPMPTEPIPNLVFFSGHNAVAIDKLIDKERCFITCEVPPFRESLRQPENSKLSLKTIGVDKVFVLNGREASKKKILSLNLNSHSKNIIGGEVGYYGLDLINEALDVKVDEILNDIQKYFKEA